MASPEKIKIIKKSSKDYPEILKEISNAPKQLYARGELSKDCNLNFAIVGTRAATEYGKTLAFRIAKELAEMGFTIVSGLALGIDTQAHLGALAGNGKTIAVLGSGINDASIYPGENLKLVKKIIDNGGGVISEYDPKLKSEIWYFPERNRIIAGLSRGVLVIEAPEKSGALITARLALEQNREVFAIPGNISSRTSFGANLLLKQGAALVTRAEDILQELNFKFSLPAVDEAGAKVFSSDDKVEEKIFDILNGNGEAKHIDEIARFSGTAVQKINAALTTMEMKGIIKNLGNGKYSLEERYLTPIEDEEV